MSMIRAPIFRQFFVSQCAAVPPRIIFPRCSWYTTYPGGASTTADGIAENPLKKQMHPPHTASHTVMEEKTKYQHFMDVSSKSVVIFGGNGYVGSACAREAVRRGLSVAVISRRGPNSGLRQDPRLAGVRWIQGDALKPDTWKTLVKGVNGVISTIGSFGSNEQMRISCGETNVSAARACKEQNVERFVFVSAHMYKLQLPFLQGYVEGKQKAERIIEELYGSGGIILRPGFIYGSRPTPIPYLNTHANIPLQLLGRPLELMASTSISRSLANVPGLEYLFVSPVSVEDVARCCVAGAIEDIEPSADAQEQHRAIILESEDISRLGRSIIVE